jgi:hypothetical protein
VHTICRCVALIVCTIWIEYRTAINVRHVNDLRGVLPLTKTRHEFLIRAGIFWYLMYYDISVLTLRIFDPGWNFLISDVLSHVCLWVEFQ